MPQEKTFPHFFASALARGKPVLIHPTGTSMQPTLREGDILTVLPLELEESRIGDILAYQNFQTGQTIVHRLVKKTVESGEELFFTMAESGRGFDPVLRKGQCAVARVVKVNRGGREIDLLSPFRARRAGMMVWFMLRLPWLMALRSKSYMVFANPRVILRKLGSLSRRCV